MLYIIKNNSKRQVTLNIGDRLQPKQVQLQPGDESEPLTKPEFDQIEKFLKGFECSHRKAEGGEVSTAKTGVRRPVGKGSTDEGEVSTQKTGIRRPVDPQAVTADADDKKKDDKPKTPPGSVEPVLESTEAEEEPKAEAKEEPKTKRRGGRRGSKK